MQWYYSLNGERQGPVDVTEMEKLLADGTVTDATRVWREGLAKWLPWREASPSHQVIPEDQTFVFEGQLVTPLNKRVLEQRLREGTFLEGDLTPARLGPRFWAYMVDSIIMYLPFTIINATGRSMIGVAPTGALFLGYAAAMFMLLVVMPGVYETWMVARYKTTLGKMIFNLEVVDELGNSIGAGRSFGRYCGKNLLGACVSFLPYASVWFTDKKQTAHDLICNTLVVQR